MCVEREQPSSALKPMANYFTTSQLQLTRNYLDDPLTGLDTGSGNDRLNGLNTGSGGDSFNSDDILLVDGVIGDEINLIHNVSSGGCGGEDKLNAGGLNYSEAVGLDSSTVDVVNKITNFVMPVSDFI